MIPTLQSQMVHPALQHAVRSVHSMVDLAGSIQTIIADAMDLKALHAKGRLPQLLTGKAIALVFEKNSTRTRISFEVGIQRLGGIVTTLDTAGSQLSRGESMEDTAGTLGRYVDAIVHRALSHERMQAMTAHSGKPVINALTEKEHPCQVLADWMALTEHWGSLGGHTFAYVGDGNNMCHSYLLGAPMVGMDIQVATPKEYAPDPAVVALAKRLAKFAGTKVQVGHDPNTAVQGADAVATDTWISMGDEADEAARRQAFTGYMVTDELLDQANKNAVFMHCMPGHWGEEATYEVAHGPRSLIYEQAENRMWVQMALLVHLMGSS
jgi:ornithine carbamoyltransferase